MNAHNKTYLSLIIILIAVFMLPGKTEAISVFSPFGGKVALWSPTAPGCVAFTTAVCVATLGSVCPNVEELVVAPPNGGTFGILRVDGMTIPGLTTIYQKYSYQIPGTWVLGKSINLCSVCENLSDVPGIGSITGAVCEIPVVSDILDTVCEFVGDACPIGNLIYKMGTSGIPSL